MGVDGCGWVHYGAGGMGGRKNKTNRDKMVVQVLIWVLWSGKFPRTSCFAKNKKKVYGWLGMGAYGFPWLRWGVGVRRDRKTRGKEPQTDVWGMFYNV